MDITQKTIHLPLRIFTAGRKLVVRHFNATKPIFENQNEA